ncbi:helix-turn-helix domain-containing protein [Leclercia sp. H6W5]|uniref:helix-turn-helix transcriptional regulator n=1 Tax=Leclercia tamurae TaxID=2926467 RepID=UPI0021D3474D|nr:helix-turn-helix transcriptional regulator [Leclercia tamurae]MCU6680481.1 helix-turn-helix domain-containing protein [Leclercia tamurae]
MTIKMVFLYNDVYCIRRLALERIDTMEEAMAILEFAGHNLAKQRKIAGLTQAELAARSKVSRATIAAIENGAADPKLTTIIAICAGISPNAWVQLIQDMWQSHVEKLACAAMDHAGVAQEQAAAGGKMLGGTAVTGSAGATVGATLGSAIGSVGSFGAIVGGVVGAILAGKKD